MNIIIYYYFHKIFILDSLFNSTVISRALADAAFGAGVQPHRDIQHRDVGPALQAGAAEDRIGKGKYKRGTSRKRVVNLPARKSEMSKTAHNFGMAHVSLKTGNIMAPKKVILLILY